MKTWRIEDGANSHLLDFRIVNQDNFLIAFCDEENTDLIAAAPDMLEALEALQANENLTLPAVAWKKIIASIKKAKGIK